MRKFLLVTFIGMAVAINLYGFAKEIYNTYFIEDTDVMESVVEVIYVE